MINNIDHLYLYAIVICSDMDKCTDTGCFPSHLKNADITPLFKKIERLLKSNCIPVSILPTILPKIYEKILYQQICEYFRTIFSKYLSGIRKGQSTQHCILWIEVIVLEYYKQTSLMLTISSITFCQAECRYI